MNKSRYPLFVKHDLDGFFGLFIDNLVQLLLIVSLCGLCGITSDSPILLEYILPGAAVSILFGNLVYAWMAHRLAKLEDRSDVTALPYGINTVSLIVYIFFVMEPVYQYSLKYRGVTQDQAAVIAWQMGILSCLGSGIIEFLGSFVAGHIRSRTPRAALLSTLSGIAISFISMQFALQIFSRPLVAMLPMAIILLTYFGKVKFPLGLPGGFLAVLIGTITAWFLTAWQATWPAGYSVALTGPVMSPSAVSEAWQLRGIYWPQSPFDLLWKTLKENPPSVWLQFLSVIVPMGLFNVIGSLQNIESAEAAGDRYHAGLSLGINGMGTLLAGLLGSCFPTTIYIGHPGWKGLGARAGYSTLNGIVIALICMTGTVTVINAIIPIEAGVAIVLWIGIVITAQAFQATPKEHAPAVALGLFPAIAALGFTLVQGSFNAMLFTMPENVVPLTIQSAIQSAFNTFSSSHPEPFTISGFALHGLIVMERGFIFSCMFLAAICVFLIERKFYVAAIWSLIASASAFVGLTHSYKLQRNDVDFLFVFSYWSEKPLEIYVYYAFGIAIGYLLFALLFILFGYQQEGLPESLNRMNPKNRKQSQQSQQSKSS